MNWHDRYSQQAQWTGELRSYLLVRSTFPLGGVHLQAHAPVWRWDDAAHRVVGP